MLLQSQFNGTERWMVMGMREKLIELLEEAPGHANNEVYSFREIAVFLVANGVTIPVKCKDCKWWHDQRCTNINGANCLIFNPHWFCCSGERKDNG